MSPGSTSSLNCATTLSVMPAGIIIQAIRGVPNSWTNSSSEDQRDRFTALSGRRRPA